MKYEYFNLSWYFDTKGGLFRGESINEETVNELSLEMNKLGNDGWKLCGVVQINQTSKAGGDFAVYSFMRELA